MMDLADLSHLCETTRFSSNMSISGRVIACRWHDLLRERRSLFFRMDCLADAHSPLLLMWIRPYNPIWAALSTCGASVEPPGWFSDCAGFPAIPDFMH